MINNEENKDFLNFLERCIQKDKDAWDTFVDSYNKLIYSYIITIFKKYNHPLKNNEADDLFNNIFLALLDNNCERLKNFRGKNEYSFIAYLRTISFNMTIDFLRAQRNFLDFEQLQFTHFTLDQYEGIDKRNLKDIVFCIIKDLPERHKYLFDLIYKEEKGYPEISALMKISINAVHQLRFRMMNNFKKIAREKNLYHELEF